LRAFSWGRAPALEANRNGAAPPQLSKFCDRSARSAALSAQPQAPHSGDSRNPHATEVWILASPRPLLRDPKKPRIPCRSDASRDRENATTPKPAQWLRFRGRDLRRSYREIRTFFAIVVWQAQQPTRFQLPSERQPGKSLAFRDFRHSRIAVTHVALSVSRRPWKAHRAASAYCEHAGVSPPSSPYNAAKLAGMIRGERCIGGFTAAK